jgi:hypothetical protein
MTRYYSKYTSIVQIENEELRLSITRLNKIVEELNKKVKKFENEKNNRLQASKNVSGNIKISESRTASENAANNY